MIINSGAFNNCLSLAVPVDGPVNG
jgi:hypothetical protein